MLLPTVLNLVSMNSGSRNFSCRRVGNRISLTNSSGSTGSEEEVKEVPGACFKRFRTSEQAQAFIEDWEESFADVWQREMRAKLHQGFRPRDMGLTLGGILDMPIVVIQGQVALCDKLGNLNVKEE